MGIKKLKFVGKTQILFLFFRSDGLVQRATHEPEELSIRVIKKV